MIFISFMLDGVLSCFLYNWTPLFTLTTLVLYSYIKKEDTIKYSVIIGLLYDVAYTDTIILNSLLFFLITMFHLYINKKLHKNIINIVIINIITIIIYLLTIYIIQLIINLIDVNIKTFIIVVFKSIIINTTYLLIMSMILKNKIFKKPYC